MASAIEARRRVTYEGVPLACLALVIVLAGCVGPGGTSTSDRAAPKASARRLVAALAGAPAAPNRQVAGITEPGTDAIEELVNVGLAQEDDKGFMRPQLAEEIPTLENNLWRLLPGGRMETTWRLKPGSVWHDGTPFTADDLIFTATVNQDPDIALSKSRAWSFVEAVEAPDAQTVLIKWTRVFFEADLLLTTFSQARSLPLPKHLLEESYREHKEGFLALPYWTRDYVGLGPFRIVEWTEGSGALLAAHERYVLGRPMIDEIEVKFIPDANTLMANILANQIDIVLGRGLSLDHALEIRKGWGAGQIYLSFISFVAAYPQHINPTPAVLSNAQFKRALYHAIDRQAMVDGFMHGMVPVADSFFAPSTPEFPGIEGSIVRYDYDPRRAEQMIGEFDYRKGPDGVFRDSANQPLSIEVWTSSGLDIQDKSVLTISDFWQRVGIAATSTIMTSQQQRDRNYSALFPGVQVGRRPTDFGQMSRLHSSHIPLPENRFTGQNLARYASPEMDDLLDRFNLTIPSAERARVLAQIVRHMTTELPYLPLLHDGEVTPLSSRLENVGPVRARGSSTSAWNAHKWVLK